ncbi:MAG: hypothetical protein A2Y98_00835 [Candidatus Portnoybacteria bacterium RBG_19FT_COMBO_36_7]|uniref:Prepilin-type N-terminal cleavage/methylation domain-containing protein n=1 Tax=Candidatus Portnoybacteria bacterium RBG_19FT_COMBO_36_7 TaxID=1801992 RepID=A0A1G2F7F9_9BACT|nr:MAG: hypothetical protein A2Y98_00835 [Candidatus Portnoybacteria bacterium RBG_19FT_COMBO_36_7]
MNYYFRFIAGKKINIKSQAGFTLIEMLVYIAILIMVLASLVIFGIGAIRTGAKIKANAEVLNNSRRAIEAITFEIRKSKSIYAPTSIFDVNPGQLSLEQATDSLAGEKQTFVDFFKCGERLCLKKEGGDPFSITSNHVKITNLVFSQLLNSSLQPSVQITLGIETAASSLLPSYSSSIEVTSTINLQGF